MTVADWAILITAAITAAIIATVWREWEELEKIREADRRRRAEAAAFDRWRKSVGYDAPRHLPRRLTEEQIIARAEAREKETKPCTKNEHTKS